MGVSSAQQISILNVLNEGFMFKIETKLLPVNTYVKCHLWFAVNNYGIHNCSCGRNYALYESSNFDKSYL